MLGSSNESWPLQAVCLWMNESFWDVISSMFNNSWMWMWDLHQFFSLTFFNPIHDDFLVPEVDVYSICMFPQVHFSCCCNFSFQHISFNKFSTNSNLTKKQFKVWGLLNSIVWKLQPPPPPLHPHPHISLEKKLFVEIYSTLKRINTRFGWFNFKLVSFLCALHMFAGL